MKILDTPASKIPQIKPSAASAAFEEGIIFKTYSVSHPLNPQPPNLVSYVYSKYDIICWVGGNLYTYESCSALQRVMIPSLIVSLSVASSPSRLYSLWEPD